MRLGVLVKQVLRGSVLILAMLVPVVAQQHTNPYAWPKRVEPIRNYDALHYAIRLRFDTRAKTFWGETRVTFAPLDDGFRKCVLDAESMRIISVTDAQRKALKFRQDTKSLTVELGAPRSRGEKVSLTISYVSRYPRPDPLRYGMPADYHLGLTFWPEAPDHPALISTMSFPEGARHWFPSNDVPADKATSDIFITVDEKQSVLSNGRLVDIKEDRERRLRTFHWAQEKPHSTYLFMIAVGSYKVLDEPDSDIPLHYWVYPKDVGNAPRSFSRTAAMLKFFAHEFGYEYPWAKYDQVTIPGIGGGAESTSATVLGHVTIHDARAEQDFSSVPLVAHEAAHQWWGDLVTMRTWSDTWLNEGFATYSEYLFALHAAGEDEAAVNLLNKKQSYLKEAHEKYMRPIVFDRYRFPNDLFDRHSYEKGALVLNMLRFLMGEDAFRRGIKLYLERYAFRSVDTEGLRQTLEGVSGQQLGWFFDQWVYRPGHPLLDISYRWEERRKKLVLHVEQKQERVHDTPIFRAPVLVGLTTAEGKTTQKVWLTKQSEDIELNVSSKPLLVRFNEGNHLLAEITFRKTDEELLFGLKHDDVIGRMWAAGELAKSAADSRVAAALMQAATSDSFWAVRVSALEAFAQSHSPEHAGFFRERALDRNSKVRVAALRALGAYRRRELLPFFIERFEREDSYLAQAEALRGIGTSGNPEVAEFLRKAAAIDSPRNILKDAAGAALKQISYR
jgi:aminopeptidase N